MEMTSKPTTPLINRFFPSAYPRVRQSALEWMALFAILLFTISNFVEPALARKGEWILLLVTLCASRKIRREDPDSWLYIVMFAFIGLMLAVNWRATALWGSSYHHINYSRDYLRIFWFLMAGWWLGGRERNIFMVFAVAIFALFISIQIKGGWLSWQHLFLGRRTDFNIHNAQHIGLLFGTLLLGLLAFMFRFFNVHRPLPARLALGTLWLLLFGVTALVVLGSQTRQIWIGFVAAAVVVSYYLLTRHRLRRGFIRRLGWITLALGLIIIVGQSIHAFDSMGKRFSRELPSIEQLEETDIRKVTINSTTIRLILWRTAFDAISERPWVGYGGGARKFILANAKLPPAIKGKFGHFHNSYLELWLSYGIAGPLVFIGILGLLAWRLASACRNGYLALDFTIFGLGWLTFFAVANLFESYVSYRSGAYLMLIVGGALYSITIPARRAARTNAAAADSRP